MSEIKVASGTQRIIVSADKSTSIVGVTQSTPDVDVIASGPPGPPGIPGAPGPPGSNGTGTRWYGEGPPGTIVGAQEKDEYLDILSGDLYVLL